MSNTKPLILFVGQPLFPVDQMKKSLVQMCGDKFEPTFVVAKDGLEATLKLRNQKFDSVVVDHKALQSNKGSFLSVFTEDDKDSKPATVVMIVPELTWEVPREIKGTAIPVVDPYPEESLIRVLAKAISAQAVMNPGGSFAVDVKVLNALIKATSFVCSQYGISNMKMLKPEIKKQEDPWRGDIAAAIGIDSKMFQGMMILSFSEKVYLQILTTMLGEEQTSINADNADAIGELSNMILGNAKSDFTNYEIKMTIPQILEKNKRPEVPAGSASIIITTDTPVGSFYIETLAFRVVAGSKAA